MKVNFDLLNRLVNTKPAFYFSIHVNHPDELNDITLPVINKIRKMGYLMISQSVFLKGVNDDVETLTRLYSQLAQNGVRPYYLIHNQEFPATKRFTVDLEKEVSLMTKLREKLSGLE